MNWSNEPATEQQLSFLQHCGYVADHPLTRSDAAEIIKHVREQTENRIDEGAQWITELTKRGKYHLGMVTEPAGSAPRQDSVNSRSAAATLVERRKEFWLDTCREMTEMHSASPQAVELYQKHGCRFAVPSHDEVQEVLDALDSALKNWEVEHPELFYQTLEINFPELVKHHA
jgi:hypothetical protein